MDENEERSVNWPPTLDDLEALFIDEHELRGVFRKGPPPMKMADMETISVDRALPDGMEPVRVPGDCYGVNCGKCGAETFRVFKREITIEADVCPICAHRIDMENEVKTIAEAAKAMEKAERRRYLMGESRKWAKQYQGQHVLLTYDVSDGRGGCAAEDCKIRGRAYDYGNITGGWGCIKIVLDPDEYYRISYVPDTYWSHNEEIPYDKAVIDGHRYGLKLYGNIDSKERPPFITMSWGDRKYDILVEIDD